MSHPTEQGGPLDQGWSGSGDETVSLAKGEPGANAGERVRAQPVAAPIGPSYQQPAASAVAYGQGDAPVGYGRPAPAGWPPPTNTKAIIALCTVFYVPVLGIVFGVMARREIARTGEGGRAYATWGMALGIAFCALIALYLVFYLLFVLVFFAGLGNLFASGAGQGFST